MTSPSGGDQPTYVDPVTGQQLFIDPTTGQLAYNDATGIPAPPPLAYPGFPPMDPMAPGTAMMPADLAPPMAGYPQTSYPMAGFTAPAYPGPVAYGYSLAPRNNSLATASMITSIVGAALAFCYGIGIVPAVVGAILGHVARRQIRVRGEGGAGMALAGIIVGWVVTGIIVIGGAIIAAIVIWAVNNPDYQG